MQVKSQVSGQAGGEDGDPTTAASSSQTGAASSSQGVAVQPDAVREKIKNGVHIIWPNIVVSPDVAWTLRAMFLRELISVADMSALGQLCEPWEIVIDPCVFGKNGLRMIWNRKASTCKVCNGAPFQKWISEKRRATSGKKGRPAATDVVKRPDVAPCTTCNTFDNKIDEGRPYEPIAVIDCEDPKGEMLKLADPIFALKMTTIRIVASAGAELTPITVSTVTAKAIEPWRKKTSKVANQMRRAGDGVKRKREGDGGNSSALVSVGVEDKAYATLSEYVATCLHCGVVSIKTDEYKHLFVVNTTSHNCRNKGGCHNRSTIYLIFYPDGYYQKCWCRKGIIYRPGGVTCENYRSQLIQYSTGDISEIRSLFSARIALSFPFKCGQPAPQELLAPDKTAPALLKWDPTPKPDSRTCPTLLDHYPQLAGLSFSEAKRIISESMKTLSASCAKNKIVPESKTK